jgi:DNA-binding transcriptional ArsR family regulator
VEHLCKGRASVGELAKPLGLTLAAVVQHVQVLEASGLIQTRKVGRTRQCEIAPAALIATEKWIAERRLQWEQKLDGLERFLLDPTKNNSRNRKPKT